MTRYDRSFLVQLILQYTTQGARLIMVLAVQTVFYNKYLLEPAEVQVMIALIGLTWFPKLLYGIISDTFPIFGSRRKSYCILFSSIMAVAVSINVFTPNA